MDDKTYWTMRAMRKFGGGFVKTLAAMGERLKSAEKHH